MNYQTLHTVGIWNLCNSKLQTELGIVRLFRINDTPKYIDLCCFHIKQSQSTLPEVTTLLAQGGIQNYFERVSKQTRGVQSTNLDECCWGIRCGE